MDKPMGPQWPPSQRGTPAGCKKVVFMPDGGASAHVLLKARGEGEESDNNNRERKDISKPFEAKPTSAS